MPPDGRCQAKAQEIHRSKGRVIHLSLALGLSTMLVTVRFVSISSQVLRKTTLWMNLPPFFSFYLPHDRTCGSTMIPGLNKVTRNSNESAVTSEGYTSHDELINGAESGPEVLVDHSYCSCGRPEYSLIPRGSRRGMDFVLFVMLTDYEEDLKKKTVKSRDTVIVNDHLLTAQISSKTFNKVTDLFNLSHDKTKRVIPKLKPPSPNCYTRAMGNISVKVNLTCISPLTAVALGLN
ncbi:hemocyanin F chain [Trichonephila clavipes]|nr:hemocyanin F chain [Trichonephila clavipes]